MAQSKHARLKGAASPPPTGPAPAAPGEISLEDLLRQYRREVLLCLALLVLIVLGYRRLLENEFVNLDDITYITGNPHVKGGLTRENIAWAWTTFHAGNWHPLTWMSLQLDATLYGGDRPNPAGFHLTNLVLHIANTTLLFLVLRRMTGAMWRSALVAALFAVHPLHVESVAWAAERKDVLSTFFGLLAISAYVLYSERPGWVRYLLVVLALGLGLLAKPMLVTLPFVLLLLDYWPLGRLPLRWRLIVEKVPLLVMAAAVSLVTMRAQGHGYVILSLEELPLSARLGNAAVAYVTYLAKTFWPLHLAVFYPHPMRSLTVWQVAGAALLLAAITVLAVGARRQRPYLLVGWFWFVGMLVPVIGLVQVGEQALADRYTYLPNVGLYLLVVWGLADLVERRNWPATVWALWAVVALGACVILTTRQVGYWQNSATLWQRDLDVAGKNVVKAHDALGDYYFREGTKSEDARKAVAHFLEALRHGGKSDDLHERLGGALLKLDQNKEAAEQFEQVVLARPFDPEAHNRLGAALFRQKKLAEAGEAFTQALALDPNHVEARRNLGQVRFQEGKGDEALRHYAEAVRSAEQSEMTPLLQKAHWLDVLAADQAEAGDFDEASRTAQRAVALAEEAGQDDLIREIRDRIKRYHKREPLRKPKEPAPSPSGPRE